MKKFLVITSLFLFSSASAQVLPQFGQDGSGTNRNVYVRDPTTSNWISMGSFNTSTDTWTINTPAINLAASGPGGVSGILPVPNGGTGTGTFTSNLPIIGNGAGNLGQGNISGNSTTFGTTNGTLTNGDCVSIDSHGNLIDAGGPCTTGGGGGTVSSGTANQLAYYSSSGITIVGLSTANNGVLITSSGGVPSIGSTLPSAVQGNITSVGTVASGTWNGTGVGVAYGGTGASTLTAHGILLGEGTSAVTPTAAMTGGQLLVGQSGTADPSPESVSGDATFASSGALTLATVNSNTGSFGSSSLIPVITVNGKGLITAVTTASASAAASSLTGTTLASGVVTSSLTTVGTIGTGVWQGTVVGATYGGTGVNNGSKTITLGSSLTTTGVGAPTLAFGASADTITFPNASDTVVELTQTQTLTNKSIAGSEINSGTVAGTYVAAVNLAASGNGGVTGLLPIANTCPGSSGASSSTYLRGDCTWASPSGSGTVIGPASSISGDVATFSGASGTIIQDGGTVVNSFNSRHGAVTPSTGDYTTGQLSVSNGTSAPSSLQIGYSLTSSVTPTASVGTSLSNITVAETSVSVTLTGGTWLCGGSVSTFVNAGNTTMTQMWGGIATSATLPTGYVTQSYTYSVSTLTQLTVPPQVFTVSSSTPIYIVAEGAFTNGTLHAGGYLECTRIF